MNNTTEEQNNYIEALRRTISILKFSLYLVISFLEIFIKLLKIALNLTNYKPFREFRIATKRDSLLSRIAEKDINKYRVRFVSEMLAQHQYNFQRTEQYLAQYKYLQVKLKEIADNEILINTEIYRDIFKRINILVVEAEKQALKQGYQYAKETKYKLNDTETYNEYIRSRVMQGESNTDYKELKERLENE